MTSCRVTSWLAYGMTAYVCASVLYLIITHATLGTPFNDSLTDRQRAIKAESARKRRNVFLGSIVISGAGLFLTRPFATYS